MFIFSLSGTQAATFQWAERHGSDASARIGTMGDEDVSLNTQPNRKSALKSYRLVQFLPKWARLGADPEPNRERARALRRIEAFARASMYISGLTFLLTIIGGPTVFVVSIIGFCLGLASYLTAEFIFYRHYDLNVKSSVLRAARILVPLLVIFGLVLSLIILHVAGFPF